MYFCLCFFIKWVFALNVNTHQTWTNGLFFSLSFLVDLHEIEIVLCSMILWCTGFIGFSWIGKHALCLWIGTDQSLLLGKWTTFDKIWPWVASWLKVSFTHVFGESWNLVFIIAWNICSNFKILMCTQTLMRRSIVEILKSICEFSSPQVYRLTYSILSEELSAIMWKVIRDRISVVVLIARINTWIFNWSLDILLIYKFEFVKTISIYPCGITSFILCVHGWYLKTILWYRSLEFFRKTFSFWQSWGIFFLKF